jgi:hypothetical protein
MGHQDIAWPALFALGAGHGINPAMGWLFAVALGFQRGTRRAVWSALGPLAIGHALAMVLALGAAVLVGLVLPPAVLKWIVGALLVALGVYRLVRSRHIVYGGMRVNSAELATWSFLMATAHGAGLMVLPLVMGQAAPGLPVEHAHHMAAAMLGPRTTDWIGLSVALVHTAGYLLVTGIIAVIVYERVGVRFLRTAWVNLDLIWAVALVGTGLASIIL